MRYIIFSDIHLSNWSAGGSNATERISQRLVDQKAILQQLIDLALSNDAILLHGGDVFHCVGSVPTEALNVYNWFINECKKCSIKYYTATGNHDLAIRKNFSEWHNILNLFQSIEERNKELSLLNPTIKFVDYQDEDFEDIKGWDIVILHKQPECSNRYGFKHEGVNWKKIAKNNRLSFYGHFHEVKKLSSNAFVIGQPFQMTQSDLGEERGCYLVNSEDWKVEFHKLDYPELKKLEKIEAKDEPKFEERIKSASFQDILVEWLDREQKPQSYLDLIQKDITDKVQVAKTFFNGKITEIYLKDFLSIDEIKVELKNGFWLVMGENGTGKTSITGEGIYWILFDETTKDLAKGEVVRNRPTKQKEAIGELSLVSEKQNYAIHRSSKNGLEIISDGKNLADGMTKIQAQEFLEKQVLGFDKNTYLASCYFSQEQLLTLAQLGDADTTNLVTNLLGFETYDSLYTLMDLKKKEVTLQLDLLEQSSVKLDNEIWKNSEQQKNLKEQIECSLKMQCSLISEQSQIVNHIADLKKMVDEIEIPTVTTEEIDVSLSALNSSKTELVTKRNQLQEDGQLRTQDLRKQLSILQKDLATIIQEQNKIDKEKSKIETSQKIIEQQLFKANKELTELLNNPSKNCPTCGAIMNEEKHKEHISKKSKEVEDLLYSVPSNDENLDKQLEKLYDQEAQIQELIENINKQILESDAEIKSLIALNFAEITKIDCDIQELQIKKGKAIKEITEANSRKDSLTAQIKQLEQRKSSLVNQLQQVNVDAKLAQVDALFVAFDKLDAEKLDVADKKMCLINMLAIYDFWHNTFSNKGLRTLLLDRFVNEFNSIVKNYCYEVSGGEFIVEFTPTSKIRSGLERNKLGLQVVYKDKIINYAALSGGEKARCNLPLCLGLNKWISQKHGLSNGIFGIMIFDELFCFTDTKFRENVAQVLFDEGKTKSIFVIDHSDTLMAYTSDLWLISKQNDVTTLQVV
jgi:DNA repair exonuclease SbcCD ATPase subunit